MAPTILTVIKPTNPAFRREGFGPVALFFRVKNEDAAIALASDTDCGLDGKVWSQHVARRIASRAETEMMFIYNIAATDAELSCGRIKVSGYRRELGDKGIQQFANKKLLRIHAIKAPIR